MPRSCRSFALLLLPLLLIVPVFRSVAKAQEGVGLVLGDPREPIVHRKDILCAGFVSKRHVDTPFEVIGGEKEDERVFFAAGEIVYLNYGANDGASVGDSLYAIRPRGEIENPFTGKDLGYYHEEMGIIRIIAVQRHISTAEVTMSCDGIMIGDVIRPYDEYIAPEPKDFAPLNRYDLPTHKLSGQIVMSRGYRDYLAERDIVFLDIGADQGVKIGQYYTIYREPGYKEGPVGIEDWDYDDEAEIERDHGFSDHRYKPADFSIIAGHDDEIEIRKHRIGVPRKVLGEMEIIRLEGRVATAVITRTTQEVNLGDYVELQ